MRVSTWTLIFSSIFTQVFAQFEPSLAPREDSDDDLFSVLYDGNHNFRDEVKSMHEPGFLNMLAHHGQIPHFMLLGCSDSRVNEGTVFQAEPGTIFTERNIANRFSHSTKSVVSYAIKHLGIQQIIVMGHYGCGGVAAAMTPPPPRKSQDVATVAIQNWIEPIRDVYFHSKRPEIVKRRTSKQKTIDPKLRDPAFRAMVEENVKDTVKKIASSQVVRDHNKQVASKRRKRDLESWHYEFERSAPEENELGPVFVHGFVYDIENGQVYNVDVSVGPHGVPIPKIPFPKVK